MPAANRSRSRVSVWVLPIVAGLVAAVAVLGFWRPWSTPSATVAAGSASGAVSVPTVPGPLALPDNPTVLIFGDSWTYGSAAALPELGYAYVVAGIAGWATIVDGVRGSGYQRAGVDGPDFGTRIAALDPTLNPDLVIVQGSINDRRSPAEGYRAAVDAAWDTLAAVYPNAQIVILGPAPQVLPVQAETARIDRDLAAAAAARGWWYLSPLQEDWITEANYTSVIDTGLGREHPSTNGHRYLAEHLASAIAAITR